MRVFMPEAVNYFYFECVRQEFCNRFAITWTFSSKLRIKHFHD